MTAKGKQLYMSYVDLEKDFCRVPWTVSEWAMWRKYGCRKFWLDWRRVCVREHGKDPELILSWQRSFGLTWGCTKDVHCHIFCLPT